ncbi:hypothetical protein wScaTNS_08120 [Wolbachia pipientis]
MLNAGPAITLVAINNVVIAAAKDAVATVLSILIFVMGAIFFNFHIVGIITSSLIKVYKKLIVY